MERDGNVAVLISPSFGAGWVTWGHGELSPFDPRVVNMVLEGKQDEITDEWCQEVLGVKVYTGGVRDLEVVWIPKGTRFSINEYDGSESIYREDELDYTA